MLNPISTLLWTALASANIIQLFVLILLPLPQINSLLIMLKDLTSGGVLSAVVGLSLPLIGASFIQMTYSLTDLFWLGQLGGTKVAAVGAVGFYMWLCNCIALITKTGVEVSVSQSIGAGRVSKAKQYAAHAGITALILALLFAGCSFLFSSSMVGFFRLEESIHNDAVIYLKWVCPAFFLLFFNLTLTGVFNGSGNTRTPFYYNAAGLILNMVLDPLLIYGDFLE